jgi:hypothetical protein
MTSKEEKETPKEAPKKVVIPELLSSDFKQDSELLDVCQFLVLHLEKDLPNITTFLTIEDLEAKFNSKSSDSTSVARLQTSIGYLKRHDPQLRCFFSFLHGIISAPRTKREEDREV